MKAISVTPDATTYNYLTDVLARFGNIDDAWKIEQIAVKDCSDTAPLLPLYCSLAIACAISGRGEESAKAIKQGKIILDNTKGSYRTKNNDVFILFYFICYLGFKIC